MRWACRLVVAALLLLVCGATAHSADAPARNPAAVIRLFGEIDDFSRDNLFRRFREAESAGADTVILELNTPGGLITSGMDISRFLRSQTHIHTIAFINTSAYSAGTLVAMACDEIVMTPASVIGDCAPIVLEPGGLAPLPPTERAKLVSPLLQDFAASCARNGYNPLLAEAMVKLGGGVYLVRDAQGQEKVVNHDDFVRLTAAGDFKPAPGVSSPVNEPDTLLTVGADVALRLGLCKEQASSAREIADHRGLTIVADLTPSFGDHAVEFLNGSAARFVLLVVFLLSLYITLHAPGHGAAEAVALLALGLLVGVPLLTGFAQWWELALILFGLALCAFELLVFPGHGAALAGGLIMLVVGLLLTFAGRDLSPDWLHTSPDWRHRLFNGGRVMLGAFIAAFVLAMMIRPLLPRLPLFRKLILTETSGGTVASTPAALKAGQDVWPFLGTVGVAVTDLRPGGVVRFPYGSDTRNAPVVFVGGFADAGTKVLVQEARGNRIVVRPAPLA